MKRLFYTLLGASLLLSYPLQAQTPYDSFSPETWRPILDLGVFEHDDETHSEPDNQVSYDTILCAAVIDRQEQMLLLVDMESLSVLAFAPLTDDLHKWISPDPLLDKYIHSTPYIYCNGNPIKYVDSDGRYFDDANEEIAQKIEVELFTKKIFAALGDANKMRELYSTWRDIQDMRNDTKHEFRFESTSSDAPFMEYGGTNANGDQIINMYSHIVMLDGTTAHETRHGGQIARGEMFYDNFGRFQNYGVRKEVDAYRAQWAWDGFISIYGLNNAKIPEILKPSYYEILPEFVKSITEGLSLTLLYPPKGYSVELWNNH